MIEEYDEIDSDVSKPLDVEIKPVEFKVKDIFSPVDNKDMKIEYPELSTMQEFDNMSNADIKFCWYFSCKSSPYVGKGVSDDVRLFNSVSEAYGKDYLSNKTAVLLLKGQFTPEILAGINKMKILSPSLRSRANAMMSKILDNMDVTINIPTTDLMAMDSGQKKAFISLCVDVANNLPGVINQLEGGFSISKTTGKKTQRGTQAGAPLKEDNSNFMDLIVSESDDIDDEIY